MLRSFIYTKASGDKSARTVYPIGVVDDKIFSIDLTDLSDEERVYNEKLLDAVHKQYIEGIKEVVGDTRFRFFFMEQMS